MAKTRILQVITLAGFPGNSALGAGAQVVVKTILKNLDRESFDLSLVVGNEGYLTAAAARYGVEVTILPQLRREISPLNDALALARLSKFIKGRAFDLVHTHSTKAGFIGRIASKLVGVPIVVHTVHGLPFHDFNGSWRNHVYKLAERFAGKMSDCLICVSEKDRILAIEEGMVPDVRAVAIPPGIDLDRYRPDLRASAREPLGLPSSGRIVGMIARLDTQKAPEDFLLAAARVLERLPDVTFLLVGDGKLRPHLLQLVRAKNLSSRFIVAGARAEIPEILSILDVFVLPSLWEGLPITILEAMAMAKPVIATAIPGNMEIVKDNVTGLLVPPRNPQRLSEAIISLLSDQDRAKMMGQEGRKFIQDGYDAQSMAARIQELYLQLLGTRQRAFASRARRQR